MLDWPEEKKYEVRAKQGWPAPFVEVRIVKDGVVAPWDGETPENWRYAAHGLRGVTTKRRTRARRWSEDGWFRTGDIATLDAEGYIRLVDRAKDLVKSGGEWISSVDLENTLMAHPAVKEACVIGLPHPKWQERPLAAVVLREGAGATEQELREFLESRSQVGKCGCHCVCGCDPANQRRQVLKRSPSANSLPAGSGKLRTRAVVEAAFRGGTFLGRFYYVR